jgi:hypothetical protein
MSTTFDWEACLFFTTPEDAAFLHVHPLLIQIRETVAANIIVITAIRGRKNSGLHLALELGTRDQVQQRILCRA